MKTTLLILMYGSAIVLVIWFIGCLIVRYSRCSIQRRTPKIFSTRYPIILSSASLGLLLALGAWIISDYPENVSPSKFTPQEQYKKAIKFSNRRFFKKDNNAKALKWLTHSAEAGCVDAQFELGAIYEDEELGVVAKNEIEALKWYKQAAEQKHIGALIKLAHFYMSGHGGLLIDEKIGFSYALDIATNGLSYIDKNPSNKKLDSITNLKKFVVDLQKDIGDCYRTGEIIGKKNVHEAIRFYGLAASQGNSDALYGMYKIYRYGDEDIITDYQVAETYLKRSADSGSVAAMAELGYCYYNGEMSFVKDHKKAFDWWKIAAEKGDAVAQYNLGIMYVDGHGVGQDYKEAVKWYRKAAEQEVAVAQFNLGNMYDKGHGVGQDYAEAEKWYRKAAEQGYAFAQNNLGNMYDKGHGVGQDYAEAVKWYRKAAEQGDASAQFNLGVMYENGEGVGQDYAEAVKWYRKAAEQGDATAQFNLGVMYENGEGVVQDYAEAVEWYRKAAEQEDEKAKRALERLTQKIGND